MTRGLKPSGIVTASRTVATVPKPPAWLSRFAKDEWRRVAPILVERAVLTEADLGTLESFCVSSGIVRQAQIEISRDGLVIAGKRHAAFGVLNAAQTTARLCAAELGLTPVSRSRPAIRDDEDADSLLDI
jgi:P27 family predicted phage terminase small subunit